MLNSIRLEPVIDLETGEPFYYEMLLPRGVASLAMVDNVQEFCNSAEERDLLYLSDFGMLGAAISMLKKNPNIRLGVNVSYSSLASYGEFYRSLLESVPRRISSRLVVEVVETNRLSMTDTTAILIDLRSTGVAVALDDYGAGMHRGALPFFNLNKAIPDIVKIDGDIVGQLHYASFEKLIQGVIQFARHYGCTLIAEKVEHEPQIETLRTLGIKYGQGFYWKGTPLPSF